MDVRFPPASVDHSQPQMSKLKARMANLFHALASTFTTCACGAKARDCVLTQLNAFVESATPTTEEQEIDLGPLVGASRGFRTREKVKGSGGIGGMEMLPPPPIPTYHIASNEGYAPRSRKGKERAREEPLELGSNSASAVLLLYTTLTLSRAATIRLCSTSIIPVLDSSTACCTLPDKITTFQRTSSSRSFRFPIRQLERNVGRHE